MTRYHNILTFALLLAGATGCSKFLEVDNIATIKDLVKKNLGISVLPESACLKELRKGSLIALPIENLSMARETRLVYNKDFSRKDVLQAITATYRETVGRYQ